MTTSIPRACVIGWPVKHSRSPMIHGYWLRELGIAGEYVREEVSPDDFPRFVAHLRGHGYVGANCTVPHKEVAFRFAEVVTDRARAVEAVNTLWYEDGRLHGDNTDGEGYVTYLDARAPGWADAEQAVVLGAGGAARGIVAALKARGLRRIVVVNRHLARAEALEHHFGSPVVARSWADRDLALSGAGLVVNTTSLGMEGQPSLEVDLDRLPAGCIVSDIVYVPLETPLLAGARTRGHRTVDGLGMLLCQAAPGFAHWFGVRPTVTQALHDLVAADLPTPGRAP